MDARINMNLGTNIIRITDASIARMNTNQSQIGTNVSASGVSIRDHLF